MNWDGASRRAILFDMDDTLYLERDYVMSGFGAVARWLETETGIPAAATRLRLIDLFEEGERGNTFDHCLAQFGLPTEPLVSEMVEVYRTHVPDIAPFAGMRELLHLLGDRHVLGMLSDGFLSVQQRKFAALGLDGVFGCVVFSDQWGREAWKPDSRPYVEALECLGVSGPEAVYVADNPTKDFIGARQLGLATIRLRHPDGIYYLHDPPTPEHSPDVTVADVSDVAAVLLGDHRLR
jgi:putative hydrolase of the HAD superfamily